MSDEYVKTVVITDPAYEPGQLMPARPPDAPVDEARDDTNNVTREDETPGFDDTSWLT
jgi:hypothetical protein